jgi:hypothetical protein
VLEGLADLAQDLGLHAGLEHLPARMQRWIASKS